MGREELAGASQRSIEHHYDVGNDFFALWLDTLLVYSCALYETPDLSIDEAQRAKLGYWLNEVRLAQGGRLLDIGCGWGAVLASARAAVPDVEVRGLTLSRAQLSYLQKAGLPAELKSWEHFSPTNTFSAVISLGAFEHFARNGMTHTDRVERYRAFFERCFEWLEPAGRLGLQTIALDGTSERTDRGLGRYFVEDVFPESSLPRLGEVVQAAEELFRLVRLRIDPVHYASTCRAWRRRLHENRTAATTVVGKEMVDHYSKMLFLAEREFLTGSATLYRFTFERRAHVVSSARCSDLGGC